MNDLQTAVSLHREYRQMTDNEVEIYNRLKTEFPGNNFPRHAARVWRFGMLALVWGNTATILCGRKVDYVENWRNGR